MKQRISFVVVAALMLGLAASGPAMAKPGKGGGGKPPPDDGGSSGICAFDGGPAFAYRENRSAKSKGRTFYIDLVVSDLSGACQVTVYSKDRDAGLVGDFSFIYDDASRTGTLVWEEYGACNGGFGLRHSTFGVGLDGAISTPLPVVPTAVCAPGGDALHAAYPSISPARDRLAFVLTEESTSWIAVAAASGGDIANGIDFGASLEDEKIRGLDGWRTRSAWSPEGNEFYFYGSLRGDLDAGIYTFSDHVSGWTATRLLNANVYDVDGVQRGFRNLTAASWTPAAGDTRNILAFTVIIGDGADASGSYPTESIEVIDVSNTAPSQPATIQRIAGNYYAHPSFTSRVSEGTNPNLLVVGSDYGADPVVILEIEPETGLCVPVSTGGCSPIRTFGSELVSNSPGFVVPDSAD